MCFLFFAAYIAQATSSLMDCKHLPSVFSRLIWINTQGSYSERCRLNPVRLRDYCQMLPDQIQLAFSIETPESPVSDNLLYMYGRNKHPDNHDGCEQTYHLICVWNRHFFIRIGLMLIISFRFLFSSNVF